MIPQLKIGIAGLGMVGGAVLRYFQTRPNFQIYLYDKGKSTGSIEELNKADFIYICVPTPHKEDFGCDTSIVEEVINQIQGEKVIIIKSTITPGTTEKLQKQYPQHKILFNPEFLTEISSDNDMSHPDRQIIGYTKESYPVAIDVINQLPLAPFGKVIPATEAELVKYFGNNWFAVKVIFANIMYDICDKLGADYDCVAYCAGSDKRIGQSHLAVWHKGYRGFGNMKVSKCLPKDLKATINLAKNLGVDTKLLEEADRKNEELWNKYGGEDKVVVDYDKIHTQTDIKVVNDKLIK